MLCNGRLRKYYTITDAGIDRINTFFEDWRELVSMYEYVKKTNYEKSTPT